MKKLQFDMDKETLKKYFNQKTFAGISVVGLLVVLMLYVFVFLNFQTKTQELESANAVKAKEVAELEEYYNNLPQYQAAIEDMQQQMQDILAQYPADARAEDVLMLAVDTQENNAIGYDSINMETPESVLDISTDVVANAGIEEYTQAISFVSKHANYVNTTTYEDLKTVIAEIFNTENRIEIDNIVYTKDEQSGLLSGNLDLNFYSVTGTGKEYIAPDITAYPAGTSDIFRSGATAQTASEDSVADEDTNETPSVETTQAD